MPPKGGNAKKETGRAKKADNEAKKQQVASAVKVFLTCCSPCDYSQLVRTHPADNAK